jgi:hypothetical protein
MNVLLSSYIVALGLVAPPGADLEAELLTGMQVLSNSADEDDELEKGFPGERVDSILCRESRELIDRGEYLAAAERYEKLISIYPTLNLVPKTDLEPILRPKIAILHHWADTGVIRVAEYRALFLKPVPLFLKPRPRDIVTLWRLDLRPIGEKRLLLADLIQNASIRGTVDRISVLRTTAACLETAVASNDLKPAEAADARPLASDSVLVRCGHGARGLRAKSTPLQARPSLVQPDPRPTPRARI